MIAEEFHKAVLKKIEEVHKAWPEPQCYLMACILSGNFGGTIWYNHSHCITLIQGRFYDKKGEVPEEEVDMGDYSPIYLYGIDHDKSLVDALVQKHYKK